MDRNDEDAARRRELGDFIRAHRLALRPEDSSSADAARRRIPGLRREELGSRAGLSPYWIARLEQGRDVRLSSVAGRRLADALSLERAEREHLAALSDPGAGVPTTAPPVSAELERLVSCQGSFPGVNFDLGLAAASSHPSFLAHDSAADLLLAAHGATKLVGDKVLTSIVEGALLRLADRRDGGRSGDDGRGRTLLPPRGGRAADMLRARSALSPKLRKSSLVQLEAMAAEVK